MKRFFILLIMVVLFVFVSCETKKIEKDDDKLTDDDIVNVDDDTSDTGDAEEDDDSDTGDDVDIVECTLDKEWLSPETDWASWAYLRMTGEIGEYNGDYVEATYTEGKVKTTAGTTDLEAGSYMNYQNSVLLADAVAYEFLNVNQTAGTGVVDYYDAMWQFNKQLVPIFIEDGPNEDGGNEAEFGGFVFFRNTFIDVNFDTNGYVTEQRVRKNCWLAVAATEEIEEEGETYDVAIGGMYGCFGENVDGSVGETLKMMFKNKMTDDRADLITWINTQADGTVLEFGDEGFVFECECYNEDGASDTVDNSVPCWQYDGPGGAEDCPPEMEGNCDPVETDDDAETDDDEVDDDPYVDPCTPNPCTDTNKTVCTDTNLDGVAECACDTGYTLDGGTECINTKNVDCTDNAPTNATSTVAQVAITWDDTTEWSTPADCAWTCDDGYEENGAGDACEAIANPCVTPDPCNDLDNAVDDSCAPVEVTTGVYTGEFACTCDENFTWTVDACVAN